ncbi:MAG: formyltransferase family protein [Lacinutrix sp.]|uniref:formyltransferase family protein n=1 Tax=Lacinutrix sp. TaxID=1937692 RepID=UPI003095E933
MKFAFVTCIKIGLSCIESIYNSNGTLDLIITIPDNKAKKKSGRIYVDEFAKEHNIPVLKVNHINDLEAVQAIKDYNIDWLFIIGWSQIASENVISAPNLGAIGAHPTLLPVGRGRAAIPWAIIKGLDKTGVTFFKMDIGVDTGLVLGQEVIPIEEYETATTLYNKVNTAHEEFIKILYQKLKANEITALKQDESKATYWKGRNPQDGKINNLISMSAVDRLVRATTIPYPGAFYIENNSKIIIWEGKMSANKISNKAFFEIILQDGFYYATNFESKLIID